MGSAKISVVAVIDLDGKNVRLVVTGTLTRGSQTALHPLIRLGRALTPATRVVVDLTDARITEAAAVEALTRHACEGHTGHPSQQVRFVLPDPAPPADAEELRQLRTEQRSWAAAGAEADQHSAVRLLGSAPACPPAAGTQHVTTAADPTGTVLPFRPPRSRPVARSRRTAPGADRTAPARSTARRPSRTDAQEQHEPL